MEDENEVVVESAGNQPADPKAGGDPNAGKEPPASGDPKAGSGDPAPAGGDGGDAAPEVGELQAFREKLAGGDEKLLKELQRYKSIESIGKAFRDNKKAASERKAPLRLSEKATDDEIKAYREAVGIPDEPDAYPVDFREDYKASDADKAILGEFKQAMHAGNVDPHAAKVAIEWYQDFAQAQQQEMDGRLAAVAKQTQADLRSEWGGEYDGNIGAIREFMTAQLGDEGFERMMGLRLIDGSRLQDDPAFVKMMAQVSTDYYGSNAIYNGDIEATSKTVQERIDELLKLRTDDPEKYKSDSVQAEITKLYAQRDRINARKG